MQIWLLKEIGLTLHEGLMPPPRPQARTDPSPLTHKHTYTHAHAGFDSVQGAESSLAQLPLPQEVQQSQEASAFRQRSSPAGAEELGKVSSSNPISTSGALLTHRGEKMVDP